MRHRQLCVCVSFCQPKWEWFFGFFYFFLQSRTCGCHITPALQADHRVGWYPHASLIKWSGIAVCWCVADSACEALFMRLPCVGWLAVASAAKIVSDTHTHTHRRWRYYELLLPSLQILTYRMINGMTMLEFILTVTMLVPRTSASIFAAPSHPLF